MRLTRIEFCGYKKLFDTSCNVDGKLIAFVGPNEAGKSSILEGLAWLTEGAQLPTHIRTRNEEMDNESAAVRATFILEHGDIDSISHLAFESPPRTFTLVRTFGGDRRSGAFPKVALSLNHYRNAEHILNETSWFIDRLPEDSDIEAHSILSQILTEFTDARHNKAPVEGIEIYRKLLAQQDEVLEYLQQADSSPEIRNAASELLRQSREIQPLLKIDLDDEVRKILRARAPEFVLFSDSDRTLRTSYDLADEQLRAAPPRAIVNILKAADTDIETVFATIHSGDTTRLKSLIRKINLKLGQSLRASWRQNQLSLEVDTDGLQLQILINENDEDGTTTAIQERSEGLRTFVALLSFLAVRHTGQPTILLIDEAETHLHVDAQADLIAMLTRQELVEKVIYTTHSPACLPTDLGTGVRLVEPTPERPGTSKLVNNFWQKNLPGFNPLLLAMGAGAAAFSVCREAVLCEGPSEMILLPSLLRNATGEQSISFQVAPGLSLVSKEEIDHRNLASKVVYLVDGDDGGKSIREMLEKSGVPASKVVSLSNGYALEDLVDRDAYLDAIVTLLKESGHIEPMPDRQSISGTNTTSKNLEVWAKANNIRLPSKVAVASALTREMSETTMSSDDKKEVQRIYSQIMASLAEPA